MKKYKITTAENAVKKGLVKEGDEVWVKVKVGDIIMNGFYDSRGSYFENSKIRIPISEPKPIDFGVAERVLKGENSIVKTTGYHSQDFFSGIYLEGDLVGFTSNGFIKSCVWKDITDTYKPE